MFNFLKKVFGINDTNNNDTMNISITAQSSYTDEVQELLMLATSYKKEKEFDKACLTLIKAYDLGGENITINDRLRLPMYMQLANKNDAGWSELVTLFSMFLDADKQHIISNQIRIFLEKENKYLPAVPYAIYSHCKLIQQQRETIAHKRYELLNNRMTQLLYSKLKEANQIYVDGRFEEEKLNNLVQYEQIRLLIAKSLKKAKLEKLSDLLAIEIKKYIDNFLEYDYVEVNTICKEIILPNIKSK